MERNTIIEGDCVEILKGLPENSVDAIVTDPPYGLEFLALDWDSRFAGSGFGKIEAKNMTIPSYTGTQRNIKCPECGLWVYDHPPKNCTCGGVERQKLRMYQDWVYSWAVLALRVLKPGGSMLSFGASRMFHRMACGFEDAGWLMFDCISYNYGCLSDDTELLIDGKWKPYTEARENVQTLCYDVEHDEFRWEPIQEVFEYDYSDTAYRITSDSTDQIVSRNHRVIVERGGKRTFQLAEDAAREREILVPILESLRGLPQPVSDGDQSPKTHPNMRGTMRVQTKRSSKNQTRFQGCYSLSCLWNRTDSIPQLSEIFQNTHLFSKMWGYYSRKNLWKRISKEFSRRYLDRRKKAKSPRKNDRTKQPSMERWSVDNQQKQSRRKNAISKVSSGILLYVQAKWLCLGTSLASGAILGSTFETEGSCTSQRPRPGKQRFGKLGSLRKQQRPQMSRGGSPCDTTLATVTPVHYEGRVWCVRVPTGAFVARRNGKIFVTGNSGFPKAQDIKGLLKKRGIETDFDWEGYKIGPIKPAWEPILWCRKPPEKGSLIQNVLQWGVGFVNVDECRIPYAEDDQPKGGFGGMEIGYGKVGETMPYEESKTSHPGGRYPANVVLAHSPDCCDSGCSADCPIKILDEQVSPTKSAGGRAYQNTNDMYSGGWSDEEDGVSADPGYGDFGGPSRFFYCAKATRRESYNDHPTLKPVDLCAWLVRMVTKPGDLVLDMFAGSGTTGLASASAGRDYLLIEKDPHYIDIIKQRLGEVQMGFF